MENKNSILAFLQDYDQMMFLLLAKQNAVSWSAAVIESTNTLVGIPVAREYANDFALSFVFQSL